MTSTWGAVITLQRELEDLRKKMEQATTALRLKPSWYDDLHYEFTHQTAKHGTQTPGNPALDANLKLNWLVEEVGEVARAINDKESVDALRHELLQVAAISLKWVESLGGRS